MLLSSFAVVLAARDGRALPHRPLSYGTIYTAKLLRRGIDIGQGMRGHFPWNRDNAGCVPASPSRLEARDWVVIEKETP